MKLLPEILASLRHCDGFSAGPPPPADREAGGSQLPPLDTAPGAKWSTALTEALGRMLVMPAGTSSGSQKGTPPASPPPEASLQEETPTVQSWMPPSPFASLASALKNTFQGSSSTQDPVAVPLTPEDSSKGTGVGMGLMVPWSCTEVKTMLKVKGLKVHYIITHWLNLKEIRFGTHKCQCVTANGPLKHCQPTIFHTVSSPHGCCMPGLQR